MKCMQSTNYLPDIAPSFGIWPFQKSHQMYEETTFIFFNTDVFFYCYSANSFSGSVRIIRIIFSTAASHSCVLQNTVGEWRHMFQPFIFIKIIEGRLSEWRFSTIIPQTGTYVHTTAPRTSTHCIKVLMRGCQIYRLSTSLLIFVEIPICHWIHEQGENSVKEVRGCHWWWTLPKMFMFLNTRLT